VGQRSRKRRHAAAEPADAEPAAPRPSGYARARERDEAARAELEPLGPGERPWPLVAAAIVAAALGAANLVSLAAGVTVGGQKPAPGGVIVFAAVMFVAAWGIWQKRYWAVLGFQALMTLIVLFFFLFLLRASSLAAAAIAVAVIAVAGTMFWKLIRVMGRMQVPSRHPQ
jgi:hypothetical protein